MVSVYGVVSYKIKLVNGSKVFDTFMEELILNFDLSGILVLFDKIFDLRNSHRLPFLGLCSRISFLLYFNFSRIYMQPLLKYCMAYAEQGLAVIIFEINNRKVHYRIRFHASIAGEIEYYSR